MTLQKLRKQINTIDSQLVSLIKKRFAIVHKIRIYKQKRSLQIYQPEREKEILARISKRLNVPEKKPIIEIFKKIMKLSRYIQK